METTHNIKVNSSAYYVAQNGEVTKIVVTKLTPEFIYAKNDSGVRYRFSTKSHIEIAGSDGQSGRFVVRLCDANRMHNQKKKKVSIPIPLIETKECPRILNKPSKLLVLRKFFEKMFK